MEKDTCPTCGTEVELTTKNPDPFAEIKRQAVLILQLKAKIETLEREIQIQNSTGR